MKKLSIVVVALLILAAGAYGGLWYTQSQVAKSQVIKGLNAINSMQPLIKYESVTTTGFPFTVGVSINKPTLDVPVSEFMKPIAHSLPVTPDGSEMADMRQSMLNMPNWQEKIVLDGRILVTVDALTNTYNIRPEGNYSGNTNIGDEKWQYAVNSGGESRGCEIAFNQGIASESFLKLWNWQLLSEDPEKLLRNIKKFDCNVPSMEYFLGAGNEQAYTSKPSHIFFENNSEDKSLDISFDLDFPGMKASGAYDDLIEKYFKLVYNQPLPKHYRLSLYGEQSMRVKGEVQINEEQPEKHPIRIVLDPFTFKSEVSDTEYVLRFVANPTGEMSGNGELVNTMTVSTNKKGYDLYLSQVEEAISGMYEQMVLLGETPEIKKEELTNIVKGIVPKTHELGKMVFAIDTKVDAQEEGSANVSINNIELGATPYGLKGNGKFELASVLIPVPTGQFDLQCRNCESFISDILSWVAKFKPLASMADNSADYEMLINMDEDDVSKHLYSFLESIDKNGSNDLNFKMQLDKSGVFTINNISADEVMMSFMEKMGPLLNPEAPTEKPVTDPVVAPAPSAPVAAPPKPTEPELNLPPSRDPRTLNPVVIPPKPKVEQPAPAPVIEGAPELAPSNAEAPVPEINGLQ